MLGYEGKFTETELSEKQKRKWSKELIGYLNDLEEMCDMWYRRGYNDAKEERGMYGYLQHDLRDMQVL